MGYGMNTCVIIICPWKIYNLEKTLLAKKNFLDTSYERYD